MRVGLIFFFLYVFSPCVFAGDWGDQIDPADVYVQEPLGYDDTQATPLLIFLQGYSSVGGWATDTTAIGFSGPAYDKGYLFSAPSGSYNSLGFYYWNATAACCDFDGTNRDHVAYIVALLESITLRYNVDPQRVYLAGYSNGGFMAHRMGCERPELFASIMSISGVGPMALDTCKASNALNILQVHGTSDLTIRFNGGNIFGVPYPSAEETAANWIAHKQCDGDPEVSSTRLNLDGYVFGAETQVTRFTTECPEVGAIELWEAITSGHTWWFWEEAFDAFFSWFDAHPQSSSCPADRNADGVIDGADLSDILGSWGQPGGDINGDGTTDGSDLATLLGAWGACG